jgi:hypothetical protein
MFSQRLLNRGNRVWQDLIIITQQPHPISGGMNKAERDVRCQTDPNRMPNNLDPIPGFRDLTKDSSLRVDPGLIIKNHDPELSVPLRTELA